MAAPAIVSGQNPRKNLSTTEAQSPCARLSQILDEATHTTVETSLLEENFAVADEDRLDRLLEHKADLYVWLKQKWSELFQADVEVLLYDLTSTYFEGETEENPSTRTF